MIYLLCVPLLLASEVISSDFYLLDQDYYDISNAEAIFDQFIQRYGDKYNKEKSDSRLKIFTENLNKINQWNKESDSATFGINQFTDLTPEEVKMFLGVQGNFSTGNPKVYIPKGLKGPSSLDYRQYGYVTPVKNQGRCGSCYAFAAIGDVEGQYAKNHGTQAISLSEQQAVDCDNQSGGCNGGWPHYVFQALAAQGGSVREEDYPYEAVKNQCRTNSKSIAVRVTGGNELQISSEQDLKDALANYGPLSIAIYVGQQFFAYRSGVLNPSDCTQWGHAVLLVGYGNDGGNDYWLIKNSWDVTWGEEGYLRLIMGSKACDIGKYVAHSNVA